MNSGLKVFLTCFNIASPAVICPLKPIEAWCANCLRPYDLIVVQYGLNVATERGVKYDGYKKGMLSVIEHLKTAFPETSILLVSVGDREYKNENGDLRTMPGVKNLS